MKGLAFRKLGRTKSHRNHLLRNLVSSLIEHERITTTVAKAKEAAREAEKIITLGKRGTTQAEYATKGYLYSHTATLPKLSELAERYATRPGGYTRIHLFGNRQGDHAPRAVLELVDNPNDLKLQMTARAMGKEVFEKAEKFGPNSLIRGEKFDKDNMENDKRFNELTRVNMAKCVKFGGEEARNRLAELATEHYLRLKATREIEGPYRVDEDKVKSWGENGPRGRILTKPYAGRKVMAGEEGGPNQVRPLHGRKKNSVIRLGKGIFAKRQGWRKPTVVSSVQA
ncbi:ribosomal protein L17 [Violaceomyces palustris]|uniref:Ribosomal protein L17 n=1 Tax=Violaceomyces palustris TaxID=1673888 RepID=A0ACD0NZE6_9BASI|nr:ribosomal protein L17 [Violaceomyces palustris]